MQPENPEGSMTGPVVIAGGSGFLGANLAQFLHGKGLDVVVLSRKPPCQTPTCRMVQWDARSVGDWSQCLEGASGLVNLTGRTVDCIKTPDHCDEILRSRVESTLVLGQALKSIQQPPPVWVQMSTAHIYGDPPEVVCDEEAPFGCGLAPKVGKAWEEALLQSLLPGMREVRLRTSFVLGKNGGALKKLALLARLGFGGQVGHGRQGMSWIHALDMNRLTWRALTLGSMQGPYIISAPNPVSNKVFMRALRKAVGMPIGLPAAEWMVRIAAPLILRTDPELALYGRYCVSRRLQDEGYEFKFSNIDAALANLF